jgi:hypothetical protein
MDLNVNFQGLKHIFKKIQWCFYKITRAVKFSELMNYFSNEKRWNRSTVHGPGPQRSGPPVYETSLNRGRPSGDLRCGFNTNEGVRSF